MEGGDRLLVLAAHPRALNLGGVGARRELAHPLRPRTHVGVELGACGAGTEQLAAMVADVGDTADRDNLTRDGGTPPADAAHEPVASRDLDQQRACRLGDVRVGGMAHDRRERAVDVEQHGCMSGVGAERLERLHKRGSGGHGL